MDTKSEDNDPGGDQDLTTPLSDDEQAMLERLRGAGGSVGPEEPAEPGVGTTLPGAPPANTPPDPLDPVFREPNP